MESITIVHLLVYYAFCYIGWILACARVPFEKINIVTGIAYLFCSLPLIVILTQPGAQ